MTHLKRHTRKQNENNGPALLSNVLPQPPAAVDLECCICLGCNRHQYSLNKAVIVP